MRLTLPWAPVRDQIESKIVSYRRMKRKKRGSEVGSGSTAQLIRRLFFVGASSIDRTRPSKHRLLSRPPPDPARRRLIDCQAEFWTISISIPSTDLLNRMEMAQLKCWQPEPAWRTNDLRDAPARGQQTTKAAEGGTCAWPQPPSSTRDTHAPSSRRLILQPLA